MCLFLNLAIAQGNRNLVVTKRLKLLSFIFIEANNLNNRLPVY